MDDGSDAGSAPRRVAPRNEGVPLRFDERYYAFLVSDAARAVVAAGGDDAATVECARQHVGVLRARNDTLAVANAVFEGAPLAFHSFTGPTTRRTWTLRLCATRARPSLCSGTLLGLLEALLALVARGVLPACDLATGAPLADPCSTRSCTSRN